MTDTMASAGTRAAATMSEQTEFSPTGEVLRDIARGGISGAIVGIVVGGLGARVVMRVDITPPYLPRAWGAVLICWPGSRLGATSQPAARPA